MEADVDIITFGLSRHHNREAHYSEFNPGLGISLNSPSPFAGLEYILETGTYRDSVRKQALFSLVGARYTHTIFCTDAAIGPYIGSAFNGFGGAYSIGVNAYRDLWIHATCAPKGFAETTTFGLFLRYKL